jgi:hypothetical protein
MSRSATSPDKTITITVPIRFERRGGRKIVISPITDQPPPQRPDNALIKALARAHRWQRMVETGEHASIADLAKAERINQSYVYRLIRLTLLAPDIVEAILNGRQSPGMTISSLTAPLPVEWSEQRKAL